MMKKRKAGVCAANPEPREEEFLVCCGGIQPIIIPEMEDNEPENWTKQDETTGWAVSVDLTDYSEAAATKRPNS